MCGIAGAVGVEVDQDAQGRMLATMARRGPDGKGCWREGSTTLLHSRLAIIDPELGSQPMELSWQGEHYCLVYNGELYNTPELREALKRRGHDFRGHSDTEVLLHAYAEYGEACLELLNGIFGFAVWERNGKRLFLARDRIGVKPLFYSLLPKGVLFASEMKTILAHGAVKARLDAQGAAQLLLLGPGRLPGSGVFRDIQELEPGCCAYFSQEKLRLRRYWKLRDREHTDLFGETAEKVRTLVTDSIRRQMVSDVPIGTFLSGGLDSSIITSVCARELEQHGARLQTFCVDYPGNEAYFVANKFQPDSDSHYIGIMQQALSTDHRRILLPPQELEQTLEEATMARDLPGMADVDFSLLAFCRQVRREVKVALSGECADEIFGGYPWYRDPEVRAREGFPWAQNSKERAQLLHPELAAGLNIRDYLMDAYRDTCLSSDILPGTPAVERRMKEMVNLNFNWFMQTLLERKDRMSMYCSLEVRVPFCDYRIAEYLYGVPWAYKDHRGREKGLLRWTVGDLLPEAVVQRKKSPYPKTLDPVYSQRMEQRLQTLLEDPAAPIWALVDRAALKRYLSEPASWPWYGQLMGRPQTMAYFLQMDFWLRHYKVVTV